MISDPHPSDDLVQNLGHAVMGIFNGDNIKQTIRDAWDKHMNAPETNSTAQQMTDANNVKATQDANQTFVDAAKVRSKVAQRMK